MLDIKEARKELKRVGCAHATGDVLRYMCARTLAFELRLSCPGNTIKWPIPELYAELGTVPDDDIMAKYKSLRMGRWGRGPV